MTKVLVVATSRKTRGGITSVIKAHESGVQWRDFHCHWVQTHRDGPAWRKIGYLLMAWTDYLVRLPFYDIIHLHISHSTTVVRKRPFFWLAKVFGKKTIVHFHAFDLESTILGKKRELYRYFFTNADKVLVLSGWWKKHVEDFCGLTGDTVRILYNPCPNVGESTSVRQQKNVLYAGTINERKGYADLLRAFAKIATDYPDWKVVFAGNGEVEEGKTIAKQLKIENQTTFLGWVSGKEKDTAFREASIFCLPSYAEGFPMGVLDAWAYGLPVITTPVGGIPDIAEDSENMLLFNPGDIDILAKQISRMISDTELRNKIISASRHFALEQFNVVTVDKELGSIYAELSKKK